MKPGTLANADGDLIVITGRGHDAETVSGIVCANGEVRDDWLIEELSEIERCAFCESIDNTPDDHKGNCPYCGMPFMTQIEHQATETAKYTQM